MDSLIYQYTTGGLDNKLQQLYDYSTDATPGAITNYTGPMLPPRYRYDPIGNTAGDLVSGQDTIQWNLYNKVIRTVNNSDTSSMTFNYDGGGNRVKKTYTKNNGFVQNVRSDYYVHDAQGNILAIYHEKAAYTSGGGVVHCTTDDFSLAEHTLYGSARLGTKEYYPDQYGFNFITDFIDTSKLWTPAPWYSLEYEDVIKADSTNLYGNAFTDKAYGQHITGEKQYELTDHLGDVLVTVSDKRATDSLQGSHSPGALDTIENWKPVLVTATDYYPFGMQMPGRYISDTATHCFNTTIVESVPYFLYTTYPFNGISYTPIGAPFLTATLLDLVMQTFLTGEGISITVDSLYPGISQTITITTDGSYFFPPHVSYKAYVYSSGLIDSSYIAGAGTTYLTFTPTTTSVTINIVQSGTAGYHLNLLNISEPRVDSFTQENVVTTVCNEDKYHYGYNGKMKDNEWAGVGNHIDFGERSLDTRTARWITIDPLFMKYPSISPYVSLGNNPIFYIDLKGRKLTVGGNSPAISLDDIKSLIPDKYRSYIQKADDNTVQFDFDKLPSNIQKLKGATLVHNLVRSPKNYLFVNGDEMNGKDRKTGKEYNYLTDPKTNSNDWLKATSNFSTTPESNQDSPLPSNGYDGALRISNGEYQSVDQEGEMNPVPRSNIIFHEMEENYLRTEGDDNGTGTGIGLDYNPAHEKSAAMGSKFANELDQSFNGSSGTINNKTASRAGLFTPAKSSNTDNNTQKEKN